MCNHRPVTNKNFGLLNSTDILAEKFQILELIPVSYISYSFICTFICTMNAANINYIKVDFTHKKLLLTGVNFCQCHCLWHIANWVCPCFCLSVQTIASAILYRSSPIWHSQQYLDEKDKLVGGENRKSTSGFVRMRSKIPC